MRTISLTQNKEVVVDDKDFGEMSKFKWYAQKIGKNYYAVRMAKTKKGEQRKCIYMHRQLMQNTQDKLIDHIDNNGLNNTRTNLRLCTKQENLFNRGRNKNNKSGYKGVAWCGRDKVWTAQIHINRKKINLGSFKEKLLAHNAYKKASRDYYKQFSYA